MVANVRLFVDWKVNVSDLLQQRYFFLNERSEIGLVVL